MEIKLSARDMAKMAVFQLFIRSSAPERFRKYDHVHWKDLMESVSPDLKKYAIDHLGLQFGQDPVHLNAYTVLNFGRPTNKITFPDQGVVYYRFNGPISEQWFNPWVEYLKSLGVSFCLNTEIKEIRCEAGEIKEVILEDPQGGVRHLQYDYYVNGLDVNGFAQALMKLTSKSQSFCGKGSFSTSPR